LPHSSVVPPGTFLKGVGGRRCRCVSEKCHDAVAAGAELPPQPTTFRRRRLPPVSVDVFNSNGPLLIPRRGDPRPWIGGPTSRCMILFLSRTADWGGGKQKKKNPWAAFKDRDREDVRCGSQISGDAPAYGKSRAASDRALLDGKARGLARTIRRRGWSRRPSSIRPDARRPPSPGGPRRVRSLAIGDSRHPWAGIICSGAETTPVFVLGVGPVVASSRPRCCNPRIGAEGPCSDKHCAARFSGGGRATRAGPAGQDGGVIDLVETSRRQAVSPGQGSSPRQQKRSGRIPRKSVRGTVETRIRAIRSIRPSAVGETTPGADLESAFHCPGPRAYPASRAGACETDARF